MEHQTKQTNVEQSNQSNLSQRDKDGIKAIVVLQGMVDIKEGEKQAIEGWRKMSKEEQDFTLKFYAGLMKE